MRFLLADKLPFHVDPTSGLHVPLAIVLWAIAAVLLAGVSACFWAMRYDGRYERSFGLRVGGCVLSGLLALAALSAALSAVPRIVFAGLALGVVFVLASRNGR